MTSQSGAELFIKSLEAQGVEYIFTVPGASIDPLLNVLVDHGPKIILCRHEQNAAFMAGAWGRITGKPGVCLATAGPGVTNLVTGIATADSERCPVIAVTGQVPSSQSYKQSHQYIDSVGLFDPITKWSIEISDPQTIPDIVANAFRLAREPREGAVHLSIPSDVLTSAADCAMAYPSQEIVQGVVPEETMRRVAGLLNSAQKPVVFLGIAASKPHITEAVRKFLNRYDAPIVATFEAAGTVPRDLFDRFMGRLGFFYNQPGEEVLREADTIITIGYDIVEYEPPSWMMESDRTVIHIDQVPATASNYYRPTMELIGDIAGNLRALDAHLTPVDRNLSKVAAKAHAIIEERYEASGQIDGTPIHPRRLIYELRNLVDDDVTIVTDVGSNQYWILRHFFCFEPQRLLTSMGFQAMGVSIPWAIATHLARPGHRVVSISGDGSFLMCSMELETAVRHKIPLIHMVWEDESFNLVKIQQEIKYGRESATKIGKVDTVRYAESMGCKGLRIEDSDQISEVLQEAFRMEGPVVISVPIDYSDNLQIVEQAAEAHV